jgi:NAD(P)-dependent dehydrogenase (short-subunit alcohol dehydrogenase family)
VVLALRDVEKGRRAAARIAGDTAVQGLDLTSLESIRAATAELQGTHWRIDLLINIAGVMYPPRQTTQDGFELQFGTHHAGHFALSGLLLELLLPVADSRIVTISSIGHRIRAAIPLGDLQWDGRTPDRALRAVEAGESDVHLRAATPARPHGITIVVAAHPGGANTVGQSAEQERIGALVDLPEERLGLAAEQRQGPSAALESAPTAPVPPAESLHHAVDRDVGNGRQFHERGSFSFGAPFVDDRSPCYEHLSTDPTPPPGVLSRPF